MGHGHGHGHVVTAAGRHRWRLVAAVVLVGGFFLVELVAGLLTGSLALLSDAGHMAADVVTLLAALVATRVAVRPDRTGRRTYGSYRAEVFASGLAVLLMLGVAVVVVVEAVRRTGGGHADQGLDATPVVVVGALGLAVNVAALLLLRSGATESLTLRGAYLEVVADTAGSVGVVLAGLLVAATGDLWWDTGVALAIAAFVLVRALRLAREVLAVLGQHAPAGTVPDDVAGALGALPGVVGVHDLHVWQLTSGMDVATAHLVTADVGTTHEVLDAGAHLLRERFGIAHATLQVEPADHSGCDAVSW